LRPQVSEALRHAARLLAQRNLSVAGLQSRLLEAGHEEDALRDALDWLIVQRYVDDREVASREAEKAIRSRNAGRLKLRARLENLQVSDEAASAALDLLDEETEKTLASLALARRVKPGMDASKAARYLSGRGFSEEAIRGALNERFPGWEEPI